MADGDIPEEVERLLSQALESYEQLETLLFLVKNPHQPRGADDLSRTLGIPEESALAALNHLRRRGLVVAAEAAGKLVFKYEARREVDSTVQALALLYEEKTVEIAKRMTANAIERVRNAAIRTFSDAFLLRKKDDD